MESVTNTYKKMHALHVVLDTGYGYNVIRLDVLPLDFQWWIIYNAALPNVADGNGNPLAIQNPVRLRICFLRCNVPCYIHGSWLYFVTLHRGYSVSKSARWSHSVYSTPIGIMKWKPLCLVKEPWKTLARKGGYRREFKTPDAHQIRLGVRRIRVHNT